jgi:exodeoxyribonuclease III
MNMKITTWNVNGIRAVLQKGALSWVNQVQPDVLCLQEVKAYREQVIGLDDLLTGYEGYWNSAKKAGYSGVAVYTRVKPVEVSFGLGDERFDQEGRVIRLRFPEFVLYNIYFPNGQRGQDRVGFKLDFYANLLDQCDRLHASGERVVITGDFNTSHREIDLANPRSNQTTSGFLPEERAWIDRYLDHHFCDAYRSLYPQKVEYTWWTYISNARARNVGWRLDYFLVSEVMMEKVREVVIHADLFGSDHCPVSMLVDTD